MDLDKSFTAKADNDGLFRISVSFSDTNLKNEFRGLVRAAWRESKIPVGLNPKDEGFELGFLSEKDSHSFMGILESSLTGRSKYWTERYEAAQRHEEHIISIVAELVEDVKNGKYKKVAESEALSRDDEEPEQGYF